MVMKKRMFLGIISVALGVILCVFGESIAAEKYPSKPIEIVIPFAPGTTDNLIRPFVEKMPEFLGGQPINFTYKPGAGGTLGIKMVSKEKPDGYTLVATSGSGMIVIPVVRERQGDPLGYTYRDFAPIVNFVCQPTAYTVMASSPWKSWKDVVDAAKKAPGKYTFTSSGTYGAPDTLLQAVCKASGIKLTYIPATGAAPAVTAVLGGHVDIAGTGIMSVFPHLQAGKMRTLASCDPKRSRHLPDVPTFIELGYPEIWFPTIYGIFAPKNTPKEVVDAIYVAAKKVSEKYKDQIIPYLDKMGAEIDIKGPEEYTDQLAQVEKIFFKLTDGLIEKVKK